MIVVVIVIVVVVVVVREQLSQGRHGGLMVSTLEPWQETLCCVLKQDTELSKCLSPPMSINGYRQIAGET